MISCACHPLSWQLSCPLWATFENVFKSAFKTINNARSCHVLPYFLFRLVLCFWWHHQKIILNLFLINFLKYFRELPRPIQLGLPEEKLEKGKELQLCAMCQIGSNCLRAKSWHHVLSSTVNTKATMTLFYLLILYYNTEKLRQILFYCFPGERELWDASCILSKVLSRCRIQNQIFVSNTVYVCQIMF